MQRRDLLKTLAAGGDSHGSGAAIPKHGRKTVENRHRPEWIRFGGGKI